MINIKKYIVSEAFEQLNRPRKLKEKLNKKEIDLRLLNKDPSIVVDVEDAFELSQYLDSKKILYDTQDVMVPIPEKNYEKEPKRQFWIDYSAPRSSATPNEMIKLPSTLYSVLGAISVKTNAFDFPYELYGSSVGDPKVKLLISRSDLYKLRSHLNNLNKIYNNDNYQDEQSDLLNKIAAIVNDMRPLKESVQESKLTEAPLSPQEYAAKMKSRREQPKVKNPLDKINAQLNPDMSIADQLQVYFDELVPAQGKADTVAGELVRAMMRVLYRDYNDGDLFYTGYGKETCGGSVVYLMDKVEDLERPFTEIVDGQYEDYYYTNGLEDAAYLLIQYLNNHPELFTQTNSEDSRNVDSNKLENYFALPQYEFEPDTSYDESYYSVSDEEIDDFIHSIVRSDLSSGSVNRWARDAWTIEDLEKDDYDTLEDMWEKWFEDFLSEHEREEEYEEEDMQESLKEDTVKQGNKWVNKGDSGETHGKFKTKKEADAQRKAMFANGYKG